MKKNVSIFRLRGCRHLESPQLLERIWLLAIALFMLLMPRPGAAQGIHTLLHTFSTTGQGGYQPENSLLLASDGTLYGTTYAGGTNNYGTIFKINPDGSGYTNLHLFRYTLDVPADGSGPQCKLLEGADGALYGTTRNGGANNYGTVFRIGKDGSDYQVLLSFTNGTDAKNPVDGVIQGADAMLYGVAYAGGTDSRGAIFRLGTNGTGYQVLHNFLSTGGDGQYPYGGLIAGDDDVLYGATYAGGAYGYGTLFHIDEGVTGYGIMHDFGGSMKDGRNPYASLMEAADGTLYGTTQYGGTNSDGTIFNVDKSGGNYTVVHTFAGGDSDGQGPFAELITGSDGAFYGTTRNGGTNNLGTVFKLNPDGSGFKLLYSFTGAGGVGSVPYGGLVQDIGGSFYGTTRDGGGHDVGTVFKIEIPVTPVLWWPLDEGAGTNTLEAVSGVANATWLVDNAAWTNGISLEGSHAVYFTAGGRVDAGTLLTNDTYIAGTNSDFTVLDKAWTITAWVRLDAVQSSGDHVIAESANVGNGNAWWILRIADQNEVQDNLIFDFNSLPVVSNLSVTRNLPLFIAVSASVEPAFPGDTNDRFSIWDGATWRVVYGNYFSFMQLHHIQIGSAIDGSAQFEGAIDDVRIYASALTPQKLEALADAGPTIAIAPAVSNQVAVSWAPADTNYVLQEATDLSAGNWTNSPSSFTNPVVVPAMQPKKYYRLTKP